MEMANVWNFLNEHSAEIVTFIALYIIMSRFWNFQRDVVSLLKAQNKILEKHFPENANPGNLIPRTRGIRKPESEYRIIPDKPIT